MATDYYRPFTAPLEDETKPGHAEYEVRCLFYTI